MPGGNFAKSSLGAWTRGFGIAAACSLLSGCLGGLIYEDITLPLDTNMTGTPVASRIGRASASVIREPFTAVRASIEWSTYGIGDAIRKGDGSRIACAADHRMQSAVLGIWQRDSVKVYGCEPSESTDGTTARQ